LLTEKAELLASRQKKPEQLFYQLEDYCWKQQIVIPSYTELAEYVTLSYNAFAVFQASCRINLKKYA